MPKKKKEKVPSYEPPPPLLSPARGRLGTPPTVEDGRWNSLVMDSKVLPVFCGVLHGPGWTEPPKSAAADGEEKKPAKKKTAKKKAGSKGERPKTTGGVNWDKFDKSYLVNTYTVGLPSPPWSKPTEERPVTVWPLKYRNADKAVCSLGCGQVGLTKKQRLKHEVEECPYRVIPCPAGCGAQGLTPMTVQEHLESGCEYKPMFCKWECGHCEAEGTMPQHEGACLYRPSECSLGCGIKTLIVKTKKAHETLECPNRRVPCPDCNELMMFKTLESHQELLCVNRWAPPCQWCGMTGLRLPEHAEHEKSLCPMRPVECKFGCGVVGLQGWREERHYKSCPERCDVCERCGQLVRYDDKAAHDGRYMYGRVPVCTNLECYCKQGCGLWLRYDDMPKHIAKDLAYSGEQKEDIESKKVCPMTRVPCPLGCGEWIPPKNPQFEEPEWKVNKFRRCDMEDHLANHCAFRIVTCCLEGCEVQMKECDRLKHEQEECMERVVECSWGCGIEGLKFKDKDAHEKLHARQQAIEDEKRRLFEDSLVRVEPVPCPRCGMGVLPRKMDWHLDKECGERVRVVNVRLGAAVKARAYSGTDTAMRGRLPPVTLPYHPVIPAEFEKPMPLAKTTKW